MQIYLQRQKVCRVTSLKTMKNVAQQIDSLLSRNKKALSLRLQYKETEMELVAAAGYPPAVAALRARLALIKAQRIALDLWQKSKLAEINSTLFDGRRTIYSKIQKAKPQTTRPFLSYRTDDRSWAPQYILNDDYSNRLKLRTRFQIALNEIIPTENIPLSHFLGRHRLPKKMVFHCTATVESRSRKHAPTFWANE